MRYWCEDETRIGLITLWARKLTAKGIQPERIEQWCFDYLWLYGMVEPKTGESFFAEISHVDGVCFEQYLKWFAEKYPDELHIIQLDNGRLHTWSELEIPENIILLFQLNNLEEFRSKLSQVLSELTSSMIASITGWDFILDALSVANI